MKKLKEGLHILKKKTGIDLLEFDLHTFVIETKKKTLINS